MFMMLIAAVCATSAMAEYSSYSDAVPESAWEGTEAELAQTEASKSVLTMPGSGAAQLARDKREKAFKAANKKQGKSMDEVSDYSDLKKVYDYRTGKYVKVHHFVNREGKNGKTGGVYKNHRGYSAAMGRNYVVKGYDSSDAHMDSRGHYYIGNGRRRIGAGFGRRRRTPKPTKYEIARRKAFDKMAKLAKSASAKPIKGQLDRKLGRLDKWMEAKRKYAKIQNDKKDKTALAKEVVAKIEGNKPAPKCLAARAVCKKDYMCAAAMKTDTRTPANLMRASRAMCQDQGSVLKLLDISINCPGKTSPEAVQAIKDAILKSMKGKKGGSYKIPKIKEHKGPRAGKLLNGRCDCSSIGLRTGGRACACGEEEEVMSLVQVSEREDRDEDEDEDRREDEEVEVSDSDDDEEEDRDEDGEASFYNAGEKADKVSAEKTDKKEAVWEKAHKNSKQQRMHKGKHMELFSKRERSQKRIRAENERKTKRQAEINANRGQGVYQWRERATKKENRAKTEMSKKEKNAKQQYVDREALAKKNNKALYISSEENNMKMFRISNANGKKIKKATEKAKVTEAVYRKQWTVAKEKFVASVNKMKKARSDTVKALRKKRVVMQKVRDNQTGAYDNIVVARKTRKVLNGKAKSHLFYSVCGAMNGIESMMVTNLRFEERVSKRQKAEKVHKEKLEKYELAKERQSKEKTRKARLNDERNAKFLVEKRRMADEVKLKKVHKQEEINTKTEVRNKEHANKAAADRESNKKEINQKEIDAKERAAKERAAKERAAKERAAKERSAKERNAKEINAKQVERSNKAAEQNGKAAERNSKMYMGSGSCCCFTWSSCFGSKSCRWCSGGNHWVSPFTCGTSRRCS
jgi:hypothetical protein